MDHDQSDKKQSPPPFLLKTFMLVEDPSTDSIISWNSDGSSFIVWHTDQLSKDLLPTLFKHSNFSSFVRQLNTYGFRKVAATRWEFYNEMFRKGERELLCNIHRRKAWERKLLLPNTPVRTASKELEDDLGSSSTSSSSSSSSSRYNSLLEENKRLKKENEVVRSELTSMKNKCSELLKLVPLNTNTEQDESPKLFGVRLNVAGERKKNRSAEINERIHLLLSQYSCR